jgi:hypothetical protein
LLYPFLVKVPFRLVGDTPATVWRAAAVISELSNNDKTEILSAVDLLRRAFIDNDHNRAFELSKLKFNDMALVFGLTPDQYKTSLQRQMKISAKATTKPAQLLLEDASFALIADGRLVSVTRGRAPAITMSTDRFGIEIPVYCAKINDRWVIAR